MIFYSDSVSNSSLVVNGQSVEKVSSCKYIGLIIDDELNWRLHTSIFYKLREILPNCILKNIYYAFVYPHILYGIEIYANTKPPTLLN